MDKIMAITLLIFLSPLLLIIALLVYLDQGAVFFVQERPGLLERPFSLFKFQTMKNGIEEDELRLTNLGKWLRKHSIDELPQLWNIIKGEMSFIGPRPYLMDYLEIYSDEHRYRHWVLPGMTGWAQVKGGNRLSWQEKLDLDIYYVKHLSFWLDLSIFIKTFWLLLSGKKKDMPESRFLGYQEETS